jgi:hypothetical protein
MERKIQVGDLVKLKHDTAPFGFVLKIDKDYYGASQAFKVVGTKRGECIGPHSVNAILPTREGIRDRILVDWIELGCEYIESHQLEVISEVG